jgi:hypothetical protein
MEKQNQVVEIHLIGKRYLAVVFEKTSPPLPAAAEMPRVRSDEMTCHGTDICKVWPYNKSNLIGLAAAAVDGAAAPEKHACCGLAERKPIGMGAHQRFGALPAKDELNYLLRLASASLLGHPFGPMCHPDKPYPEKSGTVKAKRAC